MKKRLMAFRNSRVMKFGGTSVANARAFENVARIIADRIAFRPVVIVSAMSGMTDALLTSAQEAEKDLEIAIASLDEVFTRHKTVALDIMGSEQTVNAIARIDK